MATVIDHPRFMRPAVVAEPLTPQADALVWQARAQVDIATLIERYLAEHPPPQTATHHLAYRDWAGRMQRAGNDALASLGARRLRSTGRPS